MCVFMLSVCRDEVKREEEAVAVNEQFKDSVCFGRVEINVSWQTFEIRGLK